MFKNRNKQIRAGWFIIISFILMLICNSIFTIPGMALFMGKEIDVYQLSETDLFLLLESYPWISLLVNGGSVLGTIVSVSIAWRFLNKKKFHELGFNRKVKDLGFGLLLGALSITCIFLVLLATKSIALHHPLHQPQFSTYTMTYLLLFILVGFAEEMFFRGYVMQTMRHTGNNKWVIYIVSSIIFSLAHGANPNVSLLGLCNIFFVGLLFAYMFDRTKSLWLPIGYHITWNYFQGSIFGFAVSGTEPHGLYNIEVLGKHDLLTGGAFGLEGGILASFMIIVSFLIVHFYSKRAPSHVLS